MHALRPLLLPLLFLCALCVSVVNTTGAAQKGPRLVSVRKIWDAAPHNAFTDLVRFNGAWYCAFREGQAHVSPDGALRVITSRDGERWQSAARITDDRGDLRDAKLSVTPDGRLMLCGAMALHQPGPYRHQSLVWFSKDGQTWSRGEQVGDRDVWLWRVTWHAGQAYGIGYSTVEPKFVRLYASREGRRFQEVVDHLYEQGYPNEHALVFMPDDTVHCLLRRDGTPSSALLGTAKPPYTEWSWKDLGKRVGGPALLRLPDGRIVAATRLMDGKVRTALSWLDPAKGTLTEFLSFPSGGDTSYPGLVWYDGLLWVSYYSSHEGKTSIYLAKVDLGDRTEERTSGRVEERTKGSVEESRSSTRPLVLSSIPPQPLQAAYAEADITPPLGGSMPGYFQDRKATGVLDPLKAKVLALRQGDESIAIVSCDLVGVGAGLVERIRAEVRAQAARAGVTPPRHVWVHATHSHTGGMPPRNETFTSDTEQIVPTFYEGVVDETWVRSVAEKTAAAVLRATKDLKEERDLTQHEGREATVAHYRRFVMKDGTVRTNPGKNNPDVVRPAGEIDPRVTVLRFGSNRILAVIYGVHPDTVGGAQFSADYPYFLTESLRRSVGKDWNVIFLNACCGNINHIDVNDANQLKGYEGTRRIGETLAAAVLKSLEKGQPLVVDRLEARTTKVASRLRRPSEAELKEAEERIRTGNAPMGFNTMFAPAVLVLAKTKDREHPAEVGALRLGSFALATMPGEIFVELGREVEAASPFKPTRTIGLTNGAMGYIPTRKGYAEGGYEANWRSARYEPDNGHRWAAAAARLLQEMKPAAGK